MRQRAILATVLLISAVGAVATPARAAVPAGPARAPLSGGPVLLPTAPRPQLTPAPGTQRAQMMWGPPSRGPARAGTRGARTVALTFDDGPNAQYTPPILDILRKHRVKATFCVLGEEVRRHPQTTTRIVREGHQLCNHTAGHHDMARLSPAAARTQVLTAQLQIKKISGVTPTTFRFPYGSANPRARKVVAEHKLRDLGWTIDTRDWQRPSARTITARIVNHARPGDVVLMHDGGGDRAGTVKSLDATIGQLKKKGFTFVLA
ncbi:MAG TPA: polysaccharide deacetylase family protein [Catenuloplanes sp.]